MDTFGSRTWPTRVLVDSQHRDFKPSIFFYISKYSWICVGYFNKYQHCIYNHFLITDHFKRH